MSKYNSTFAAFLFIALSACSTPTAPSPKIADSTVRPSSAANDCQPNQFVACSTGEDCTMRNGALVQPEECFDHAQDACDAASCAHGCDIYKSSPKQVLCAPNSSSTGDMKVCGGIANWDCPEMMRCEFKERAITTMDASGVCVPS